MVAAGTLLAAGGTPATARSMAAARPPATALAGAGPAGLGGKVWNVIPTHAKVVALTFDAGGNADGVSQHPGHARAQHVAAPLLPDRQLRQRYPAQAKAMAAAGRAW